MFELISPRTEYNKPHFANKHSPDFRAAKTLGILRDQFAPHSAPDSPHHLGSWKTYKLGTLNLEEFIQEFEEQRNELTTRRLRGHQLSAAEEILLVLLNRRLDELLFRPAPVKYLKLLDALTEAKRLLAVK